MRSNIMREKRQKQKQKQGCKGKNPNLRSEKYTLK